MRKFSFKSWIDCLAFRTGLSFLSMNVRLEDTWGLFRPIVASIVFLMTCYALYLTFLRFGQGVRTRIYGRIALVLVIGYGLDFVLRPLIGGLLTMIIMLVFVVGMSRYLESVDRELATQ